MFTQKMRRDLARMEKEALERSIVHAVARLRDIWAQQVDPDAFGLYYETCWSGDNKQFHQMAWRVQGQVGTGGVLFTHAAYRQHFVPVAVAVMDEMKALRKNWYRKVAA